MRSLGFVSLAVAVAVALVIACSPSGSATPPGTTQADNPPAPQQADAGSNAAQTGVTRGFDEDAANAPPPGFLFARTGVGAPGQWVVRAESGAPSGANVLAQLDADRTDERFPLAVLETPSVRDVRVSVQCQMVSGEVDQACGLVARYRDEDNYYVTRANAIENNIRLYYVRNGRRQQIATWSGAVTANTWHAYRFEVQGDHLRVFWDDQLVIDHRDATFVDTGRVGLWTKADSVTYFDELRITPL